MSNPFFRFKQFTVWHDKCAMKVGTDGVLLGAWAFQNWKDSRTDEQREIRILDIGTGTGLIALMMAQRWSRYSRVYILGIDIDAAAVQQAETNFSASPWSDCLSCRQVALQELRVEKYDLIVSNPPYFADSLRNPDPARRTARHTDTLSYDELLAGITRLMSEDGSAALILPADSESEILTLADSHGLYPSRLTYVSSKPGHAPKRILIELTHQHFTIAPQNFHIESAYSPRSAEYTELTKDFYL